MAYPPAFLLAIAFTLQKGIEGGYYDGSGAHDPNPTNFGITQDTYNRWQLAHGVKRAQLRHVRGISRGEVEAIYFQDYWMAGRCGELALPLAIAHFDTCVNLGIGKPGNTGATGVLQRAAGVYADGVFGPKTLAAVRAVPAADLLAAQRRQRQRFYVSLARRRREKLPALPHWIERTYLLEEYLIPHTRAA